MGEYKMFRVQDGYQVFWCPSAPRYYADKIPYNDKIYSNRSAPYRQATRLNTRLKNQSVVTQDLPSLIFFHQNEDARKYFRNRLRLLAFLETYQIYPEKIYLIQAIQQDISQDGLVVLTIQFHKRIMPMKDHYKMVPYRCRFVLIQDDFQWLCEETQENYLCESASTSRKDFFLANNSKTLHTVKVFGFETRQYNS